MSQNDESVPLAEAVAVLRSKAFGHNFPEDVAVPRAYLRALIEFYEAQIDGSRGRPLTTPNSQS